jgi:hypothetical protein
MMLVLMLAAPAAALMVQMDDVSLASGADDIVIGDVLSVSSAWNADHTHIVTTAQVSVNETLKGDLNTKQVLAITSEGGIVGDTEEWVEDQPFFIPGSQVAIFLEKGSGTNYSVYGLYQGVIPISEGRLENTRKAAGLSNVKARILSALNGTNYSEKSPSGSESGTIIPAGATITSVSPAIASAGTETVVTIYGSGFGTKANRESNADVAFYYGRSGTTYIYATGYPYYSYNVNDIVSWTNTMIQVKVPTGVCSDGYSGGASSGYLRIYTDDYQSCNLVPFTVTFSYGKSHWTSNPTYYVNPSPYTSTILPAISRASNSWNSAGTSFRVNYGGATSATPGTDSSGYSIGVQDSTNILYWGSRPSGVIATAWRWTSGGHMTECDIVFSTAFSWVTTNTASGSQMNMETTCLHEMGHWLCLKDLYGYATGYPHDNNKIMFGICSETYGNKNQVTLDSTDIAGIQWIYGSSGTTNDRIGSFLNGYWYIDQDKSGTVSGGDVTSGPFGMAAGVKPVVISNHLAVFLNGYWYIDSNGNGYWDGYDAITGPFGAAAGAYPLIIGGHKSAFLGGYWYIDQDDSGSWSGADVICGPFGAAAGAYPLMIGGHKGSFLNGYWYIDRDDSGTWTGGDVVSGPFGTAAGAVPFIIDDRLAVFLNGYWYIDTDNSGTISGGDRTLGPYGTAAGATPFVIHGSTGSTSILSVEEKSVTTPSVKTPSVTTPADVPKVDIPKRQQMNPGLTGPSSGSANKNPFQAVVPVNNGRTIISP